MMNLETHDHYHLTELCRNAAWQWLETHEPVTARDWDLRNGRVRSTSKAHRQQVYHGLLDMLLALERLGRARFLPTVGWIVNYQNNQSMSPFNEPKGAFAKVSVFKAHTRA